MFSQKHILVCLGFCLSAASPAFAIENPVDTLPKADTPPVSPDTPVTVEKERTVSPQVQKVLSTVIHPESFGIQGAQAIPFEEVAAFFAPYANKDITIGELIVLSRKVTDLYQRRAGKGRSIRRRRSRRLACGPPSAPVRSSRQLFSAGVAMR